MRRAILAIVVCLLFLSLGCQKRVEPDSGTGAPEVGQPTEVTEISEGISDAETIEENLNVGDELDENFIENLDW